MSENVNTETSAGSFWNQSSGSSVVDEIAKAVVESVEESGPPKSAAVEESPQVSPGQEEKPAGKPEKTETESFTFKSQAEAEKAYRERQSAADKAAARLAELERRLADQDKLVAAVDRFSELLPNVDDPELQKAIQEAKLAAGRPVVDRTRVDHKTATELEKHLAHIARRLDQLESERTAAIQTVQQIAAAKQLESEYPFAPTVKTDAERLLAQHAEGKIDTDRLTLELANIGYKAGRSAALAESVAASRTGSEPAPAGSALEKTGGKPPTDEDLMMEALQGAMRTRRSFV